MVKRKIAAADPAKAMEAAVKASSTLVVDKDIEFIFDMLVSYDSSSVVVRHKLCVLGDALANSKKHKNNTHFKKENIVDVDVHIDEIETERGLWEKRSLILRRKDGSSCSLLVTKRLDKILENGETVKYEDLYLQVPVALARLEAETKGGINKVSFYDKQKFLLLDVENDEEKKKREEAEAKAKADADAE